MKTSLRFATLLTSAFCFALTSAVIVKFTNIECKSFDANFSEIKTCRLKALARNKIALNMHIKLLQVPLNNITVSAQLMRKSSDYRPFLYNMTSDVCKFLTKSRQFLFWKILYDQMKSYTNFNHTCPINHDLIVDNLILNASFLRLIPFPPNKYMIKFDVYRHTVLLCAIKIYISIE